MKKKVNKEILSSGGVEELLNRYQEKLNKIEKEFSDFVEQGRANGEHLREEHFIPAYLGFKEHIHFDKDDRRMIVYFMAGHSLSKLPDGSWALIFPGENPKTISIKIPNLLVGITVLQSLGLPISVETVTQRTVDLEKIDKKISEGIKEAK